MCHQFLLLNAVLCLHEQDFLIFIFSIISAAVGTCHSFRCTVHYAQLNDLLSIIHYPFFLNTVLCLFEYNFLILKFNIIPAVAEI